MTEWLHILQNIHTQIIDPARFPLAMIAILIVTLFGMIKGPLGGVAQPFYWHLIEIFFGKFGNRMNKEDRPQGDLIFRGFVLVVIVLITSFGVGKGFEWLSHTYPQWSVIEIFALALVLTSGAVWASQGRLYRALNEKKAATGAYYSIARTTRTDLSKNDDYTITRIGMGMGLKAFDKGMVAPILWYLILGITGAYLYAGLAALQWIFGRDGHSGGFGKSINALEQLMGFMPNIFSGFLIAFAGILTPTAGMTRAFLGLMRVKGKASYGEGGLPMTAAAYALNVSLGGPTQSLDGGVIKRGWIGPKGATAQLNAKHLHRAVYISFMAHLLFLASIGGAMIFGHYYLT